jgi:hypothetical protein
MIQKMCGAADKMEYIGGSDSSGYEEYVILHSTPSPTLGLSYRFTHRHPAREQKISYYGISYILKALFKAFHITDSEDAYLKDSPMLYKVTTYKIYEKVADTQEIFKVLQENTNALKNS